MKIIAQCTPSLGLVSLQWARAIQSVLWPMRTGHTVLYLRDGAGGEIAETRNAIVDAAMRCEETTPIWKLFWVDDDVIVHRDLDVRIALVVAQRDVEARFVFLDEVRFQNERVRLGRHYDRLDSGRRARPEDTIAQIGHASSKAFMPMKRIVTIMYTMPPKLDGIFAAFSWSNWG